MYPAFIKFIKRCKSITTTNRNAYPIQNQLGRWCNPNRPAYFTNAMLIMDRSNEDNCGVCGDYSIFNANKGLVSNEVILNQVNKYEWGNLTEEDIYYYPYTM